MDSLYRTGLARRRKRARAHPAKCGNCPILQTMRKQSCSTVSDALETLPRQPRDATVELEVEQPDVEIGRRPAGTLGQCVERGWIEAERGEHGVVARPCRGLH